MSDTPRTDAEALRINNINTPNRERVDDYHDMFVFARNLERELAASRELLQTDRLAVSMLNHKLTASQAQIEAMKCCENCGHEEIDIAGTNMCELSCDCIFDGEKRLTGLKHWKMKERSKPRFRCADRDDGCGHCPRSEPHTHPDEQPGDDCYRRKGRVTCERVTQ